MVCVSCRQEIEEDVGFCPHCGTAVAALFKDSQQAPQPPFGDPQQAFVSPAAYPQQQMPPTPLIDSTTYLMFAILTAMLCFFPLGIPAIIYATKINTALALGDFVGAQQAAKKSRLFSTIAACIGVVGAVLAVVFYIIWISALNIMY